MDIQSNADAISSEDSQLNERIHVLLARQGVGSRRQIESWIRRGYVHVDGKPAKLGQKIDLSVNQIKIRGRPISLRPIREDDIVVYALFKPRGVITTAKDPEGRETVLDLVPKHPRVFPVGRLDVMSEGLLLLTNDGELAFRIMHPRFEVPKIYEVKIRGELGDKKIDYLKKGVRISGEKFKGAEILNLREVTDEGFPKYLVTVKVFEGKNHHVRQMFEAIRCRVIRLKRIAMGPIELRGIARGRYRILPRGLVRGLRESVGLDAKGTTKLKTRSA